MLLVSDASPRPYDRREPENTPLYKIVSEHLETFLEELEEKYPEETRDSEESIMQDMRLRQPVEGYRAAVDPVFLAAAVDAKAGQRALDLGCGAGAALLCLARRVDGALVDGLEVQPEAIRIQGIAQAIDPPDIIRVAVIVLPLVFVDGHAIPTGVLGFAAGNVGLVDDFVIMQVVAVDHGDADAAVNMKHLAVLDMGETPHIRKNCLRRRLRALHRCPAHQDDKLVAAEPGDDVALPDAAQ